VGVRLPGGRDNPLQLWGRPGRTGRVRVVGWERRGHDSPGVREETQRLGPVRGARDVWEWCADWWAQDYYARSPTDDPAGPDSGASRVLRGGSWSNDNPDSFRCAYRDDSPPGNRRPRDGFRVARTLTP